MDIVKAYEIITNRTRIKENDELLNISINRLKKGITSQIIVYRKQDFEYCVVRLIEEGITDAIIEQTEDTYRIYVEEKKEDLKIEGEFIIR